MQLETIEGVGKSILNLSNNNNYSISLSNESTLLTGNYNAKSNKFNLESDVSIDPYRILTSIGNAKQTLIVQQQIPNGNVELSFNKGAFLQLDAKFSQNFQFNHTPIIFRAEYIKQKPNLSVEFLKSYSCDARFPKNRKLPIRGSFFLKYGKSIDMRFNFLTPFFESHFSVDSDKIRFSNSVGSPSFFVNFFLLSDYLETQKRVGLFIKPPKIPTFSISYDLATNLATFKAETQLFSRLKIAYSRTQMLAKDSVACNQCGCIVNFNDKLHSKLHLKFISPKEAIVKYEMKRHFKNYLFDNSFTYSVWTGEKSFVVNITLPQ